MKRDAPQGMQALREGREARSRRLSSAERMDDLDSIAFLQTMLRMPPARHDLAVHLHRHAALGEALARQKVGDGGNPVGQGERLAVQS